MTLFFSEIRSVLKVSKDLYLYDNMTGRNLIEYYGDNRRSTFIVDQGKTSCIVQKYPQFGSSYENPLKKAFREIFLPQGYPSSVSDDYLEYQIWDTVQGFCSSITG